MLSKMTAIEYNWLMSMLSYISKELPKHSDDYGLANTHINILSAYPKDLTTTMKPSIIVQKVDVTHDSIGFGRVLGEYRDPDTDDPYDVYGKVHEIIVQIDILAKNRTQASLLASVIGEQILTFINFDDYSDKCIPLYNYKDIKNPILMGRIDVYGKIDITDMTLEFAGKDQDTKNGSDDYRAIVRFQCRVVQSIIDDNQDIIDLSKPLKWNTTIII